MLWAMCIKRYSPVDIPSVPPVDGIVALVVVGVMDVVGRDCEDDVVEGPTRSRCTEVNKALALLVRAATSNVMNSWLHQ